MCNSLPNCWWFWHRYYTFGILTLRWESGFFKSSVSLFSSKSCFFNTAFSLFNSESCLVKTKVGRMVFLLWGFIYMATKGQQQILKLPETLLSDFLQSPFQFNRLVPEVRRHSLCLRPLENCNLGSTETSLSNALSKKIKT